LGCVLLLAACSTEGEQKKLEKGTPEAEARVMVDLAEQQRANGNIAAAIDYYRRAIKINSADIRARDGLGAALLDADAPDEAAATFQKALQDAPHDATALGGLGAALVALDHPDEAAGLLRKGLPAAPTARGYRALVVAEDLLGDYPAAIADAKAGLERAPDDLGLRDDLGLSQALAGQMDEAIASARLAASAPDATARHRLNFALVLGLADRTADARKVAATDLPPEAVDRTLAFYALLRKMPPKERAAAMLKRQQSRPTAPQPSPPGPAAP
jgi:tetratricopeptide (TPR) repeat protein